MNQLTSINSTTLGYIWKLEVLFLSSNKILFIGNAAFARYPLLENVFLDNNQIRVITSRMLYSAPCLDVIVLSNNPLEVIEPGAFSSNPKLTMIYMLNTKIHTLMLGTDHFLKSSLSSVVSTLNEPPPVTVSRDSQAALENSGYVCHLIQDKYTMCYPCAPGSFKLGTRCVECPVGGFYQDSIAQFKIYPYGNGCLECPKGSFVTSDDAPGKAERDCAVCPQGTDLTKKAGHQACFCLTNHYRLDRFGPCLQCAKGYTCHNDSVSLSSGFYWHWPSNTSLQLYNSFTANLQKRGGLYDQSLVKYNKSIPKAYACPMAQSCIGGLQSKCASGYRGPLCAICSPGFYHLISRCQKCPTLPWIVAQIVIIVIVLVVLLGLVSYQRKQKTSSGRSMSDMILAKLKIVIGFYQVTSGTFESFTYVSWPPAIMTLAKYVKMMQLNLLQMVPLGCLSDSFAVDAYLNLAFVMSFNLVVIIVCGMYFLVKTLLVKNSNQFDEEKKNLVQREAKASSLRVVFVLLFITYPSTCVQIFQMLPETCHDVCTGSDTNKCDSYLRSDYSVKCNDEKYKTLRPLFYLLLAYPILFPILALFLLWKYQHKVRVIQSKASAKRDKEATLAQQNAVSMGLRFLYENYSDDCWFWEVTELMRKVLLTSVMSLMDSESRTYLGLSSILSGLFSVFFAYNKPIPDFFENWLQLASLLATSVNMTAGLLLKIPAQETTSGLSGEIEEIGVTALLLFANVFVVLMLVAQYVVSVGQILWNFRNNPQCSFECCLMLLLTLSEAGGEVSGGKTTSNALHLEQLDQMAVPTKEEGKDTPNEIEMKELSTSHGRVGRYGNQADHFLGSIAFAKGVNRTLVLPPWRTYKNIPFSEFFEVSPLREYHRVMLMEEFLEKIAPKYWPVGKRIGYCWLPPQSTVKCTLKEGNPFQQFWDELGVDFDGYMSHHLSFDVGDHYTRKEWNQTFPPSSYPVLALRGAPARYPVIENHRHIQRYLKWSPVLLDQANKIIIELLPKGPFVGIHLRNGLDWENACRHVEGLPNFMASPQCLGYTHYRKLTKEICLPSKGEILNRTKTIVESIKATTVYVATDNDPMLSDLKAVLLEYKTSVVHANPGLPQIDLIILAKSDFFIGNCVSSFTAHVKRERDVNGLPSVFWGYHE